jgi:hypothetical protein
MPNSVARKLFLELGQLGGADDGGGHAGLCGYPVEGDLGRRFAELASCLLVLLAR